MELKYTKPSLEFSKEEKQTCRQMCDFLSNILKLFSEPEKYLNLIDYYGSSWDEDMISDIYEFCDRVAKENAKEKRSWELE